MHHIVPVQTSGACGRPAGWQNRLEALVRDVLPHVQSVVSPLEGNSVRRESDLGHPMGGHILPRTVGRLPHGHCGVPSRDLSFHVGDISGRTCSKAINLRGLV